MKYKYIYKVLQLCNKYIVSMFPSDNQQLTNVYLFCRLHVFFMHTGVQRDFHIRRCSCRLTVTRRVAHAMQELLTLSEHMSSTLFFGVGFTLINLVICVMFCRSLFVLLSDFSWSLFLTFFDLRLLITFLVFSNFS
jgi:hypothetical protein